MPSPSELLFWQLWTQSGAFGHKPQIVSYKGGFISEADVLRPQRTAFNEEDVLLEDR